MIVDIDKKNNNLKVMNILQLKWIQLNLILKKKYKKILKIKYNMILMNIGIFIINQ